MANSEEETEICQAVQTSLRRGCYTTPAEEMIERFNDVQPNNLRAYQVEEESEEEEGVDKIWVEGDDAAVTDNITEMFEDNGFTAEEFRLLHDSAANDWVAVFSRP